MYYFYVKANISIDFQISISVYLSTDYFDFLKEDPLFEKCIRKGPSYLLDIQTFCFTFALTVAYF